MNIAISKLAAGKLYVNEFKEGYVALLELDGSPATAIVYGYGENARLAVADVVRQLQAIIREIDAL